MIRRNNRSNPHNKSKNKPAPDMDHDPLYLEYLNAIKQKRQELYAADSVSKNTEFYEQIENIALDRKTSKRLKKYFTKTLGRKTLAGAKYFRFKYSGVREVILYGLEINNLGTYFYIPDDSIKAAFDVDKKKWTTLNKFYKGMRFKPDETMVKLYPGMFSGNKVYEITNEVLTIYYSFKEKKDLVNLAKYLLFQQVRMIYRKKHERQRNKNY